MLRVAIDATPLLGTRTGIGVLIAGLIDELAERETLALRAFALSGRGYRDLPGSLPLGVRRVRAPMAAAALQEMWRHLDGPVIEWWTGRVDVVHGTNFVVPPARRAAEVVSVHDLTALRYPELCSPATLRYPPLIRRAIARGAWVHTVSEAMAGEIVALLGAPAERVRVVAPGVHRPALVPGLEGDPPGRDAPGRDAPDRGRPYVLALGRAEPRKDLPLLVAAFDELAEGLPELDLVIAGPGGWGGDALQAAVAGARHRDRIRRVGWVSDAGKAELLRRAAVFAYPSVYEGFGIPPLEAMAAGVPVVATAAGGIPEAVGAAATLVPVGDRDALAAALGGVLGDGQRRARMVAAGRERAALFTWRRCADGVESLYSDAAGSR